MSADGRTPECPQCGYSGEFSLADDGRLRCPACGREFDPAGTDSADHEETRRGFLRSASAGAIGAVGVGQLAGEAGADEWPECQTDSASIGRDDCSPPGVEDDGPNVPAREVSVGDPPITYAGIRDIRDDALCLTLGSGCTVWSVASLFTPVPGDEVLVVGSCAIVYGACTARQVLIGLHGRRSEWSIYRVVREHGTENESRRVKEGDYLVLPGGD